LRRGNCPLFLTNACYADAVILREAKLSGGSDEIASATDIGGVIRYARFSRFASLRGRMTLLIEVVSFSAASFARRGRGEDLSRGPREMLGGSGHPIPSSSGDSSGVPQTRQITAEQSPQVSGSVTSRAHFGQ